MSPGPVTLPSLCRHTDSPLLRSNRLHWPKGPGAAEGEGYILAIVYRAASHASHLAVFEAQRVGEGPIARAHFDHHIPSSFHGTWVPSRSERVV